LKVSLSSCAASPSWFFLFTHAIKKLEASLGGLCLSIARFEIEDEEERTGGERAGEGKME
jgi:hypothetical protein